MKQPIKDYARIGLLHFMAYPEVAEGKRSFLQTLREILADDYFSAVELGPIADDRDRQETRELLAQSGFAVAFGAQGILLSRELDLAADDESKRGEAVRAVCEGIDEAVALGASACGILAGKDPGHRFKREPAKARLAESVERLCRYAADKGDLVIELEQFGGYEP